MRRRRAYEARDRLAATVAAVILLGCRGTWGREKPSPIEFKVTTRDAVEAGEPRQARSPDGKVVLRVEGARFKGTVRLYDAEKGVPLGPAIALEDPGLSY